MHVTDPPSHPPSTAPTAVMPPPALAAPAPTPAEPAQPYEHCDECGSPVDADQRYCVVCGAHRRHVNDPAARYLGQASSRGRGTHTSASSVVARRPAARSRSLGAALVLALIPVAAAIGVAVGRSSNNDDSRLIQALARHQAATVTTTAASSPTAAAAATRATTTSRPAAHTKHHKSATATKHRAAKANSTTQFGTVTQITGSKPTKAQEQQGAQAAQKVGKSTGKTYVNQQNSLPGTVVVP
jgi:hypothetical protein